MSGRSRVPGRNKAEFIYFIFSKLSPHWAMAGDRKNDWENLSRSPLMRRKIKVLARIF